MGNPKAAAKPRLVRRLTREGSGVATINVRASRILVLWSSHDLLRSGRTGLVPPCRLGPGRTSVVDGERRLDAAFDLEDPQVRWRHCRDRSRRRCRSLPRKEPAVRLLRDTRTGQSRGPVEARTALAVPTPLPASQGRAPPCSRSRAGPCRLTIIARAISLLAASTVTLRWCPSTVGNTSPSPRSRPGVDPRCKPWM